MFSRQKWCVLAAFIVAALSTSWSHAGQSAKPIRVAIFGNSAKNEEHSMDTARNLQRIVSQHVGAKADILTTDTFRKADLTQYDVLMFPGGSGKLIARGLGEECTQRVRDFVNAGGGAVGICAGAYYLSETPKSGPEHAELINAHVLDRAHWERGQTTAILQLLPPGAPPADRVPTPIDEATSLPVTLLKLAKTDLASSRSVRYHNGPTLVPNTRPNQPAYVPLARFASDLTKGDSPKGIMAGRDAIIASFSGKGKVVAISPHPESSPILEHWVANSVKWAADKDDHTTPTVDKVLEGK